MTFLCSGILPKTSAAYVENEKVIIRMFECNGDPVDVVLRLPGNTLKVRNIDFNGKDIGEQLRVEKAENNFCTRIHFGKYQIVTLEVETNGKEI